MTGTRIIATLAVTATLSAATIAAATAQESRRIDIGEREYLNNCAVCHGASGKGDGPMAGIIDTMVPDLTKIQSDNDGIFPFEQVYSVIDGRTEVSWHGNREMPVWGNEYDAQAPEQLGYLYSAADAESFVRGRILALVGHIHSLQDR